MKRHHWAVFVGMCAATAFFTAGCSLPAHVVRSVRHSEVLAKTHTGLLIAEAKTGKIVARYNADRYFTPASNIKIFTLLAALNCIGDSIPALQYRHKGDTLVFRGTADPTFLHPDFEAWNTALHFLSRHTGPLQFQPRPFTARPYAPGWAWEDYDADFQPERTALPVCGNIVAIYPDSLGLNVSPAIFQNAVMLTGRPVGMSFRTPFANQFYISDTLTRPVRLPLLWGDRADTLQRRLLEYFLHRPVYSARPDSGAMAWTTLYNHCPLDTLLRRMMYQSDNFLAEQLILMCNGTRADTIADKLPPPGIDFTAEKPRWVDGSGLSRYNLITPAQVAAVLRQLWLQVPSRRLYSVFPTAGQSGTSLEWLKPDKIKGKVYAKTGSMGGIQTLSGYWIAPSGKEYVFSWMINHHNGKLKLLREEINRIFKCGK